MAIAELHVQNYRSIRNVRLKLGRINVLVGANGCGKSNLYQSMYLLAAAARGDLALTLAAEGGMPSVLWAGPRKKKEPGHMTLAVTADDLEYALTCGLPAPQGHYWDPALPQPPAGTPPQTMPSQFQLDPEVKQECIAFTGGSSRVPLLDRDGSSAWARDEEGRRVTYPFGLDAWESVLAQLREPHRYPQIAALRQELLGWRFYHQFRTDMDSPLRQPQVGVRTPVLSHDGRDLAAALQTIREVGDGAALDESLMRAFPGAELTIKSPEARFSILLKMSGISRPFQAGELSDGTLRYLCLLAALLSPRPPSLLALNEPENSIHPDLLEPLAVLLIRSSRDSQLWITTHSPALAQYIEQHSGVPAIRLERVNGETRIVGQKLIEPV